jgi:hypothetical protein
MNETSAIIVIVIGGLMIFFGFTANRFYAAPALRRPLARWKGQTLFVGIGIVFLLIGLQYFFFAH